MGNMVLTQSQVMAIIWFIHDVLEDVELENMFKRSLEMYPPIED